MRELVLIDGTYELFRFYYGHPPATGANGQSAGAIRGLFRAWLALRKSWKQSGTTHALMAFDSVIESFRNQLFAGYKTGAGIDADLWSQAEPAERLAEGLGFAVARMHEFEADDALASAALHHAASFERVVIATPDKDLAQCVRGEHVVMWDRKKDTWLDEAGVLAKYGVAPSSIPDWLALVGDTADGIPGLPGFGEKSAALVLRTYGKLENIPNDAASWTCKVRGAEGLAKTLQTRRDDAQLYRTLATLRTDAPLPDLQLREPNRAILLPLLQEFGIDDAIPKLDFFLANDTDKVV